MTDLFHIPGDTGKPWRFNRMIEYISNFPDEIGPVINSYMEKKNATDDDRVWWVLLYSSCYCMGTALVLFENLDFRTVTDEQIDEFWKANKAKLIFQSDRRYIKNMNQFPIIAKEFLHRSNRKPFEYISKFVEYGDPCKTYNMLYKEIGTWKYYGRFSIVLFIFNLCKLFKNIQVESNEYDWRNGATTTSAIFNVRYEDDKAAAFDAKEYKLTNEDIDMLTVTLGIITQALKRYNPNKNWSVIYVSSDLCSYRKLFKGTRYLGFYVDRQQEEIITLENNYPEYSDSIWNFVWGMRQKYLDHKYLGELNGWKGCRGYHAHRFLETGLVTPPDN